MITILIYVAAILIILAFLSLLDLTAAMSESGQRSATIKVVVYFTSFCFVILTGALIVF